MDAVDPLGLPSSTDELPATDGVPDGLAAGDAAHAGDRPATDAEAGAAIAAALDRALAGVGDVDAVHPVVERATRDLLGGALDLDRRAVSAQAGVSTRTLGRFWRALGFPQVDGEDPAFAQADLTALRNVAALVRHGEVDEATALGLTRACARSAERLAEWQRSLLAEAMSPWAVSEVTVTSAALAEGHDSTDVEPDPATAAEVAERIGRLADELEPLLVYTWRRHLAAAVARMVADADPEGGAHGGLMRGVGFADLVSFTSLVRRLSERELGVVVQRFEDLATDAITAHGGRVVKTVGDEVLFVALDAPATARIGLALQAAIDTDPLLPQARIGLAYGPVVSRLGDVFGTTVNKAARLTAVAPSGRILVDEALAAGLRADPDLRATRQRTRTLRGVGAVTPYLLQLASAPDVSLDATDLDAPAP